VNKPFGNADEKLSGYVTRVYAPEDAVLAEIRARSAAAGLPDIQVAALDALHLEVLARAAGARRAVEIGTLGGYSGVALLRGMAPDGELDTIELSERHAEVARESFRRAGVAARARIHVGAAADILPQVARRGPFDLVFIDADKPSTPDYVRWGLKLTRPGSIIVIDNVVRNGDVLDATGANESAAAMRQAMAVLAAEPRVTATVIQTVGSKGYDGFAIALVTA